MRNHQELYFGMSRDHIHWARVEARRITKALNQTVFFEINTLMDLLRQNFFVGVYFGLNFSKADDATLSPEDSIDLYCVELEQIIDVRRWAEPISRRGLENFFDENQILLVANGASQIIIAKWNQHKQRLLNIDFSTPFLIRPNRLTDEERAFIRSSSNSSRNKKINMPLPGVVSSPDLIKDLVKKTPVVDNLEPTRVLGQDTPRIKNFEKIYSQMKPTLQEEYKKRMLFELYDFLISDQNTAQAKEDMIRDGLSLFVIDNKISKNFVKKILKDYLPQEDVLVKKLSKLSVFKEKQNEQKENDASDSDVIGITLKNCRK